MLAGHAFHKGLEPTLAANSTSALLLAAQYSRYTITLVYEGLRAAYNMQGASVLEDALSWTLVFVLLDLNYQ
jgi:hypothetical protein